jgi:lysophospholipase L1-like esterase
VWHSLRGSGTPLVEFEAGLQRLVAKALEGGVRVTLCTPTVIGELPRGKNPLDEQLDAYAEAIRRIAAERRTGLVDLRQAFQDHLETHNRDRRSEGVLTTDGVHLNAAGNALLAAVLLRHFDAEHE